MNKICTNIEEGKKLLELGLNSSTADMAHCYIPALSQFDITPGFIQESNHFEMFPRDIPAWSLSALLKVLPKMIDHKELHIVTSAALWYMWYDPFEFVVRGEDLLSVTYEMCCYLLENNKLNS